jgi:hypothetical protein
LSISDFYRRAQDLRLSAPKVLFHLVQSPRSSPAPHPLPESRRP